MRLRTSAFAMLASCGFQDKPPTVVEPNDLGIRTLETDRHSDELATQVIVRALGADGAEIASLRRTTGTIPGLGLGPPSMVDQGTEVVLTIAGVPLPMTSMSQGQLEYTGMTTAADRFLTMPSVAETLRDEADIVAHTGLVNPQPIGTESAFYSPCDASRALNDPGDGSGLMRQCCWETQFGPRKFFHLTNETIVQQSTGNICTSQSGGSCSGTGCTYGPLGNAIATLYGSNGLYAAINDFGSYCSVGWSTEDDNEPPPDITGWWPRASLSCCADGSGRCGNDAARTINPDERDCSECGGPGGADGYAYWDF